MANIIGRERQIEEIHNLYYSRKAQLVAVYGRRRVGKTFLVDEALPRDDNIPARRAVSD